VNSGVNNLDIETSGMEIKTVQIDIYIRNYDVHILMKQRKHPKIDIGSWK